MELLRGKSEQAQGSCYHPKEVSFKSGPWNVMSLLEGGKGRKGRKRQDLIHQAYEEHLHGRGHTTHQGGVTQNRQDNLLTHPCH